MMTNGKFSEAEACEIFHHLIDAIEYIHNAGYIHRDIKLDNILVDNGKLLLSDWGFASSWRQDKLHTSYPGSPNYCSPEIIMGIPYVGPEVDIWSLGVVLFAMVAGRLPFADNSAIRAGNYEVPLDVSTELCDLLSSMFCMVPNKRATIKDVKNSAWVIRQSLSPP
jgi:serine/threonine protein kinase